MKKELPRCLTALFRFKGKELLTEREFVYAVSYDLHWFPPKDAQKLLDISVKTGALKLSQGMLAPTFQLSEYEVKMDYRPPQELLGIEIPQTAEDTKDADPFSIIIHAVMSGAKVPKKEVVAKINKAKERLGVDINVAALVVAREYGLDLMDQVVRVESTLFPKV